MRESDLSRAMSHVNSKECRAIYHRVIDEATRAKTERQAIEDQLDRDGNFEASHDMSFSRRLLVQAACQMWSGGHDVEGGRRANLARVLSVLDEDNLRRLVRAMEIDAGFRTDETEESA